MPHSSASPSRSPQRTGVWLVGARGSVATTVAAGAAALRAGLRDNTGLVTAQPAFAGCALPDVQDLVFGGHDVVEVSMAKRAELLAEDGVIPPGVLPAVMDELSTVDQRIRPGVEAGTAESGAAAVRRLADDLVEFQREERTARTIVVNVASTEAPTPQHPSHASLAGLRGALAAGDEVLAPSSLYAMAAFEAGCPYVEFTPSMGPRLPALDELARRSGVPYAGADGKTGETLIKTVLAPMFVARSLRVRSWSGTNLLGGGDGRTLADPERAASKLRSKEQGLEALLGEPVTAPLHIDYVPDMGGWKTSWNHIGFEGFLGVRMRMQVTWEGCDSALAAPLVLDLVRLIAAAHRRGRSGALPELSFFFKDPLDATEPADLAWQYQRLLVFAETLTEAP